MSISRAPRTGLDSAPPGGGEMAERLTGTVVRLVYTAPGGEFAVLRLSVPGRPEPVLAVGRLGEAMPGETLALEGSWERHPAQSQQFPATAADADGPSQ